MRVLQVVTLVTPTGAFGGPVRVSINQSRALKAHGHDVTVVAATSGYAASPHELDGVPVVLFPARQLIPGTGFAGLTSPAMIRWFLQCRRSFDVVHVHLARDLVTLPIARLSRAARLGLIVQTHGMIDATDKLLARPLDLAFTRPVLSYASSALYLTEREREDLVHVARQRKLHLRPLTNGVPESTVNPSLRSATPEVLYLARLQARKRPLLFVAMAVALLNEGIVATFALVGPDEGEGDSVREAIRASGHSDAITWEGAAAPDDTLARMRRASVYVLPSVDEPYPMSVLESMSVGVPVIVTDTCGLAPMVTATRSGIVVDATFDDLVAAARTLVTDKVLNQEAGRRAHAAASEQFGMESVATELEKIYDGAFTNHER